MSQKILIQFFSLDARKAGMPARRLALSVWMMVLPWLQAAAPVASADEAPAAAPSGVAKAVAVSPPAAKKQVAREPFINWSPAQKLPKWLQIGGQVRGRLEIPSGTSLVNNAEDAYYASRLRLNVGVQPTHWLTLFLQVQDARTAGYRAARAPASLYNSIDFRQAYVSIGREGAWTWRLRAGRQELSLGSERLIGPAEWNISRTFDALDLTVDRGKWKVDFVAGSPVQIDNTRLDRHRAGDHFYGVFGSWKSLLPGATVEPYLLFKQNLLVKGELGSRGDGLISSPGVRVVGKLPRRVDYSVEGIVQRGSYAADVVRAFGYAGLLGWTLSDGAWKPRISGEYDYSSGDHQAKDGRRTTFDQFYPSNHGYYGMIDQFGWRNLSTWRVGYDAQPARKWKVRLDVNDFWLATTQDSLYASAGTSAVLNRKATSRHVGLVFNTIALYQWTKLWRVGAGYGHLFAGQYLKESKAGFGYTYPYAMVMGTF